MPTFNVITAVHPLKARHLPHTAESILSQKMPSGWDLRWYVMVDGSEYEDVYALMPHDRRIWRGHTEGHQGAACARNLLLSAVVDGLVRIMDGDDILMPGALAADIESLAAHPESVFVCSSVTNLLEDGETDGWSNPPTGTLGRGQLRRWWTERDHMIPIHPATLTTAPDRIRAVGGWMALPMMCEDIGMIISLNMYWPGYFRDEISMHYRIWPEQSTDGQDHDAQFRAAWLAVDQRLQAMLDLGLVGVDDDLYS